jgi:hypothetical protein
MTKRVPPERAQYDKSLYGPQLTEKDMFYIVEHPEDFDPELVELAQAELGYWDGD